jgi:hypothetical protein
VSICQIFHWLVVFIIHYFVDAVCGLSVSYANFVITQISGTFPLLSLISTQRISLPFFPCHYDDLILCCAAAGVH